MTFWINKMTFWIEKEAGKYDFLDITKTWIC